MRKITIVETFDGQRHESIKDATKHLDTLCTLKHNEIIFGIIRAQRDSKLIHHGIGDFVNNNLPLFAELVKIKTDYALLNAHDEED